MNEIRSIQYLRGVASIAVVLYHMGISSFSFADAGVDLFFIISGFVILQSVSKRGEHILSFQIKRLARVAPPYWLVTAIGAVLVLFFPTIFGGAVSIDRQDLSSIVFSPTDIAQSLLFIPHYSANNPKYVLPFIVVGWTLCFELFFYLTFSFFLKLKNTYRVVCFTILILVLISMNYVIKSDDAISVVWTSPLLIEFVFGLYLGLWFQRSERRASEGRSFLSYGLVLVGVCSLILLSQYRHDGEFLRVMCCGVPCLLLAIGCLNLEHDAVMKYASPLKYLGDYSYSIYLVHPFIISFFVYHSFFANRLLSLLVIFLFCIGLSSLFAKFVEIPLSKSSRKLLTGG